MIASCSSRGRRSRAILEGVLPRPVRHRLLWMF
jgi:hypothetical protein